MKHVVYITTNLMNGKQYVGVKKLKIKFLKFIKIKEKIYSLEQRIENV